VPQRSGPAPRRCAGQLRLRQIDPLPSGRLSRNLGGKTQPAAPDSEICKVIVQKFVKSLREFL
jgi:hypothetical protein